LLDGSITAGFLTDLWNCRRVAKVIRWVLGVSYNTHHLGRVLHALGFSAQKPQRRARERDELTTRHWRDDAADQKGELPHLLHGIWFRIHSLVAGKRADQ
jgi:hypothetical protein